MYYLDPPDEPLWVGLDLASTLLARNRSGGGTGNLALHPDQHDVNTSQLMQLVILDAAHEHLRVSARAPEDLADSAYGKAEMPRIAYFNVIPQILGTLAWRYSDSRRYWYTVPP